MRPELISDLSAEARQGFECVSIDLSNLPPAGALLTAVGAFLTAAEKNGMAVSKESNYGRVRVYTIPTEDENEAKLASAKREWDQNKERYYAAQVSGTRPEDYTRYGIEKWARAEGLDLPWKAEDEDS